VSLSASWHNHNPAGNASPFERRIQHFLPSWQWSLDLPGWSWMGHYILEPRVIMQARTSSNVRIPPSPLFCPNCSPNPTMLPRTTNRINHQTFSAFCQLHLLQTKGIRNHWHWTRHITNSAIILDSSQHGSRARFDPWADWDRLQKIVERHADTLDKRWMKMTRKKQKVLLVQA